jgi:hypothetical protein
MPAAPPPAPSGAFDSLAFASSTFDTGLEGGASASSGAFDSLAFASSTFDTTPPRVVEPEPEPASVFARTAAFVYRNLADAGLVAASSSAGMMGAAKLQDPHIAKKWRGSSNSAEFVTVDLGSSQRIDTVALIGLNLTRSAVCRVRASNTDVAGTSGDAYDSSAIAGAIDPSYGYFVHLFLNPVLARYVRVDLADSVPYIEAGRAVVGLRSMFETNFTAGWGRGRTDLSRRTQSRGGQTYISRAAQFRTIEVSFDWVTREERDGFVEDMDLVAGQHDDVLFVTNQASDNLGRDTIWGLFDDMQGIIQPYAIDIFRKSYRISERL